MVHNWRAQRPKPFEPKRKERPLYANAKWRKLATAFLQYHPFCVLCLAYGQVNRGAEDNASARQSNLIVDHIVPHRGDSDLFWDQSNWQTLCRLPCHDSDKRRIEVAGRDWWEHWASVAKGHRCQQTIESLLSRQPEHVQAAINAKSYAWRS